MSGRVQNKVALVTAAGQGIGRAIAEALIAEGAIVIATDLADDKLAGLKAKKLQKLDVLSPQNVEALAKAVANELTGETVGDTSQFEVVVPGFKGVTAFDGVLVEGQVKGRVFKNLKIKHPEGNEDGHDD